MSEIRHNLTEDDYTSMYVNGQFVQHTRFTVGLGFRVRVLVFYYVCERTVCTTYLIFCRVRVYGLPTSLDQHS